LLLRESYARARVPMLPVVRSERETLLRIVAYTVALVAVSALPWVVGSLGLVYLAGALTLGAVFIVLAVGLARAPTRRRAALVFHYSLLYLALVFVVAAVDAAA